MLASILFLATMSIATTTPNWTLTFADDFDGPAGSPPSSKHWSHNLGGGGWGNNELESYTDGGSNSFLDGKGHLIIEARKEKTKGADGIECEYSSARLVSQGKFSQKYGRVEARIKVPQGKGVWPAFWMLGDNINKVGWPKCGEIDILESIEVVAKTAHGTLHGPGYSGGEAISKQFESKTGLADAFHIYAIEWSPKEIKWFIDDHCYSTVTPETVKGHDWVFDQPFFMILNLAIGGNWPGYPDASTTFPQRLIIDYVKVYKES